MTPLVNNDRTQRDATKGRLRKRLGRPSTGRASRLHGVNRMDERRAHRHRQFGVPPGSSVRGYCKDDQDSLQRTDTEHCLTTDMEGLQFSGRGGHKGSKIGPSDKAESVQRGEGGRCSRSKAADSHARRCGTPSLHLQKGTLTVQSAAEAARSVLALLLSLCSSLHMCECFESRTTQQELGIDVACCRCASPTCTLPPMLEGSGTTVPQVVSDQAVNAAIDFVKLTCQQTAYIVGRGGNMEEELQKFHTGE